MPVYNRTRVIQSVGGSRFVFPNWTPYKVDYLVTESKNSIGHNLSDRSKQDVGGPFTVTRSGYEYVLTAVSNGSGNVSGQFTSVSDSAPMPRWSEPAPFNTSQLNSLGNSLRASVSVTAPSVSVRNILSELVSDGPPKMLGHSLKEKVGIARKAGSEYLNYEFGWLPFVNDLRNYVRTVRDSQKILDQYYRDANRPIRRRAAAPPETFSRIQENVRLSMSPYGTLGGTGFVAEDTTRAVWFAGRFRYYMPMDNSLQSRLNRYNQYARRLFGLGIMASPAQVWDAAPWTWLVDWFSDIGDQVHNLSDTLFDGLVMDYGYVMCHTQYRRTSAGTFVVAGKSLPVGYRYVSETKKRLPAHPFGFGLTDADLNPRQLAILGALGATQGHRGN